jgi:hypothetical protein
MNTALKTDPNLNLTNLAAAEKELRAFSRRVGADIKADFATPGVIRYLRPDGTRNPVTLGALLIGGFGALTALGIWRNAQSGVATVLIATVAVVICWLIVGRWLRARTFFLRWRFTLMRYVGPSEADDFPHLLLECPAPDSVSGFGYVQWKDPGVESPGDLLVGIYDPAGRAQAVIPLARRGRLAIRSTARGRWFTEALAPLSQRLASAAAEFDKRCDNFMEINQSLHRDRALNFRQRDAIAGKSPATPTDPDATWDRLILADSTLATLQQTAALLQNAETFRQRGISVPRGILLYGPPGSGKTQIARTLAREGGLHFVGASIADLKAGYLGQSGQRVREVFASARAEAPSILFIDELDVLAPARSAGEADNLTRELTGQLLQELDGIKATPQTVFVLAATNLPDVVDPAILSRFPKRIEIPLPTFEDKVRILKVLLAKKPVAFELESGCRHIAGESSASSGRDLRNLVESAEQNAVARALTLGNPDAVRIELADFELPAAVR